MNPPDRFDPDAFAAFRVVDRSFDRRSRTATLAYAFDHGPSFVETITFETAPGADVPESLLDGKGFERALLHLHIAAGTSYYKAAAPPVVDVESVALSDAERQFHHHLYDDGLREFAVENGMPVPHRVDVRSGPVPDGASVEGPPSTGDARPGGLLVPIGGGKDSMVLIEALRPLHPRLFAVNPHPLVVELAEQAGMELLVVRRSLSPELATLNATGAHNGHVPITAIVSLIAAVGSFVYGYDIVAMAVERSASEETVLVDGVPVNHQYSKSLAFEQLLRELLATSVDPGLVYGSALRPYSELAIACAFATLVRYDGTFCSCNTVFRGDAAAEQRWCGQCPKCRFVALMLAPFVKPDRLAGIFGVDLFDQSDQIGGFAALMSDDDKPFECVGERRESAGALRRLAELPEWRDKPVVAALSDQARAMVSDADVETLLRPEDDLAFPEPGVAAAVERFFAERA